MLSYFVTLLLSLNAAEMSSITVADSFTRTDMRTSVVDVSRVDAPFGIEMRNSNLVLLSNVQYAMDKTDDTLTSEESIKLISLDTITCSPVKGDKMITVTATANTLLDAQIAALSNLAVNSKTTNQTDRSGVGSNGHNMIVRNKVRQLYIGAYVMHAELNADDSITINLAAYVSR